MQTDASPALSALLAELRQIASALPGAEEYVMVHHPAFRVGKKPFVVAGMSQHQRGGPTVTVNLGVEMQHQLLDGDPRFTRTPYIGQHGWVTIDRASCRPGEVRSLVTGSWERIASKKQLAQRSELGPTKRASTAKRSDTPKPPSTPKRSAAAKPPSTTKRAGMAKPPSAAVKKPRVYAIPFSSVYPLYLEKAEKKGRTKAEVDQVIAWLTGYDGRRLKRAIDAKIDLETFYTEAPRMSPHVGLITGVVCGIRVEEIEDPLMQKIRYLDKLVDELARGKKMESILRK